MDKKVTFNSEISIFVFLVKKTASRSYVTINSLCASSFSEITL